MSEVKPHLFLGGYREAAEDGSIEKWYERLNFQTVICVAAEIELPQMEKINIHHLPIADDDPSENITSILPDALRLINESLNNNKNVLVHCRSGASRAPCVVLAILVDRYGMSLIDAFHYLQHRRPVMKIFPKYLDQLQKWAINLQHDDQA